MKRFLLALAALSLGFTGTLRAALLDTVVFGDSASETAHALNAPQSVVVAGGLGQSARRMQWDPADTEHGEGGYLDFAAKCDPLAINYVTLKLWGSDTNATASGILLLYQVQDGRLLQVGYRDQQVSEFSPLAWATRAEMPIPGRFYYTTIPLPLALTQGRDTVQLRVVGAGLNALGSLPVYRAYVHTGAYFEPAPGDPQASGPPPIPVRPSSSAEWPAALAKARATTIANMNSWLANNNGDLGQLVDGYSLSWTPAYQNALVPPRVVANIDATAQGYFADPNQGQGWGGNWGWVGERIAKIGAANFGAALDEVVDLGDSAGPATRRVLWSKMLKASREAGRFGRRGPTSNQGIISDKEVYNANKGLLLLGSPDAFTDEAAKRYLREAVGLEPWLGPDLQGGGSNSFVGTGYLLVTPAGLTKEDGYVSAYGEVYDVAAQYWTMTGDTLLKNRAVEMFQARSFFRYPMVDDDGYRSFRMVGPLDWRSHQTFPFDQAYGERGNRITVSLLTKDPLAVAYARQMFEDNQGGVFGTDLYAALALEMLVNEPDSGARLPMTEGQPDFAWADVDNGVVAIKRGEELTWISPYWQSRSGLHSIGRAFQITPTAARMATVRSDLQFDWNGVWGVKVNGTGWNGVALDTTAGQVNQAYVNDRQLHGPAPANAQQTREEFIGRAAFYATRYGRYLVGINMHKTDAFVLQTPAGFTSAMDLITREVKSGTVTVAPFSAVVLDLGTNVEAAPRPHASKFLTATGTAGGIQLCWEGTGGAQSFTVKRATASGGPYTTLATGLGAVFPKKWGSWPYGTFLDSTAAAGTTYHYLVTAVNGNGEGDPSPEVAAIRGAASKNTLPAPWVNQDIGTMSPAGNVVHNSGTFTVTTGGGDIWNSADKLHFIYQPLAGDGTVTARVVSQSGGKVGVMIRDTLAANSIHADLVTTSGIKFEFRASTGGGSGNGGTASGAAPYWVRLVRSNTTVTAWRSTDGITWTEQASRYLPALRELALVGLCATNNATFDNVSVVSANANTAPSGLAAAAGNARVQLTWLPANGAASYTVKRATTAGGPYSILASSVTALAYTDSTAANGTTYFYVVSGAGSDSAPASATPSAIPAGPGSVTATATGGTVTVSWNAVAGAGSYTVFRSTDGVSWTALQSGLTGTSYQDSGLPGGQTYLYAVAAVNAAGSSALVSAGPATAAPGAPRLLEAGAAGSRAFLKWTAVPGATGYVLRRAPTSGGAFQLVASGIAATVFSDTTIATTGDYFYTVAAVNAAGESAPSVAMKLGRGTGLLARIFNNTGFTGNPVVTRIDPAIVFDWGQTSPDPLVNTDNFGVRWTGRFEAATTGNHTFTAGGADDYFRMTINGVTLLKNQSVTTTLTAGVQYDVVIDFYDNGGAAYFSLFVSVDGGPAGALPPSRLYPEILFTNFATGGTATAHAQNGTSESAAKAFDGSAATKWFTGVNGATGWLRYQFASGVARVVSQYRFVSANDVPQRDPAAWDFQGSTDGTTWTTLDTQASQAFTARGQTKTYPLANTAAFTHYRLNITANSGGSGFGIQLAELGLDGPDPLPAPPATLTATAGNGQATLGWSTVAGATGYKVQRSVHAGGPYSPIATVAGATGYTDLEPVNGFTYYYVVAAAGPSGQGENSGPAAVTLPPTPPVPAGLSATPGNAQVALGWLASAGATGYRVQRATSLGGVFTPIAEPASPGYTDSGLTNGTAYFYRISALAGTSESADSAPVNATPRMLFADWQGQYFNGTQLGNPAVSGAGADANGDGYKNLLAYAFNASPWANLAPALPVVQLSGGYLTITFTRRKPPTDVGYTVQVSGNLTIWNSGPTFTTELPPVPLDANTERVTVRDNTPAGSAPRYLRLEVTH